MKTAVQCSMRAVAGFLDHLKDAGYLDDTVVVVTGDHLKIAGLGTSFDSELKRTPNRSIIYRVWSPDPVVFERAGSDQLSALATTLELLGFQLDAGRAGLGVSFVHKHPATGTLLELTEERYRETVNSPSSELYQTFWAENA